MSKVKQESIKKAAMMLYNTFPDAVSNDFESNKELYNREVTGGTKRFRNRVCGEIVNIKNKEGRIIQPPHRGKKDDKRGD